MIKKYALLLLIIFKLNAFEDSDIDGVADVDDLCPNSSFEDIIDENGCAKNKNYWGELLLNIGIDFNFNNSTPTKDYTFLIDYNYHEWNLLIYNFKQSNMSNDLYLSMGYNINSDPINTKVEIGTKILTKENDYFSTISLNYIFNKLSLLSQLDYTITGKDYQNSFGYSFGLGYMINDNWYSDILYQNSTSIYYNGDYRLIVISNSYNFDNFFTTLSYSKGLDELSYDHVISLKLGVAFE